jgi:superfamily II DNA/RNA helicase
MLFSATLDGDVDVLVRRYQRSPVVCEVQPPEDEAAEAERVEHRFVETTRADRVELTAKLVVEHGSTVVFCRTKHGADRVARVLARNGVTAAAIHGNRSQGQRERALAAFTAGDAQALVATDVAARGIHVDDVACVVHFDLPADAKAYIHRSGRTGRAGGQGVVVSFVTEEDKDLAKRLRRDLAGVTGEAIAAPAPRSPDRDRRRARRRGPRNPSGARRARR